jgi:hypothetical protein
MDVRYYSKKGIFEERLPKGLLGSIQEDNIKAARLSKLLTPTLQD